MKAHRKLSSLACGLGSVTTVVLALAMAACSGDDGAAGAQGTVGPAGSAGPSGNQGATGPSGETGQQGDTGDTGSDGESCSLADNGDGTSTLTCPGSDPITISNGQDGQPCTVTDNGDGTTTIACPGSDPVTITNGSNGQPCTVTDNMDGTVTVSCPGSDPVTITNGADGTDCTVVDNGDGTKTISCTDGTSVLIAPPIDTNLDQGQAMPGVNATVVDVGGASNADGSFAAGDHLSVTFGVTMSDGKVLSLEELDFAAIWVSGPTNDFQRVIPADRAQLFLTDVKTKSVNNGDGTYTYTFDDPLQDFGSPLWNTTKFTDGVKTGALTNGTYTIAMSFAKNYTVGGVPKADTGGLTQDFQFGDNTVTSREVVTQNNCQMCHVELQHHDGAFRDLKMCQTCHTPGAEDANSTDSGDATPVTIELKVMAHKIHSGFHLPSVQGITTDAAGARVYGSGTPYVVGDRDYSSVLFPGFPNFSSAMPKDVGYSSLVSANRTKEDNVRKGPTKCADCHDDPDGAGPFAAPVDGGDAIYGMGTRKVCGSCHDDVDWAKPYVANGATMGEQADDASCGVCHKATTGTGYGNVKLSHTHPISDKTANPDVKVAITGITGGTGANGNFQTGDPITVAFTLKDANNADFPINSFDSFSLAFTGPTSNRQVVIPGALTATPYDITGRLAAASTTNKGIMSKVVPTTSPVSETFTVAFTSSTAYTVTGSTTGNLGSGTLSTAAGTNPSGSSIANVILGTTAVAETIDVDFTSATNFTVTGSVSGSLGSGNLAASTSSVTRFANSKISFNLTVGTTAAAAGNKISISVFKGGAANPVLFAIVGGRTAFAAGDRFYSDFIAPAATYSMKVPMDLQFEYLGNADGNAGQVLTAGNLPVYLGRQTLWEVTGNVAGSATTVATASTPLARYLYTGAIATLASNDYIVIDRGLATEEYTRVSGYDTATNRVQTAWPLRYAHAVGAAVQEVTAVYRQEGASNYYVLNPATGQITINAASAAGNAFFMTYRTDGRFGWKRKNGDSYQSWYFAPLAEAVGLDETWGDWRGKPIIDGTYTLALWAYQNVEYQSVNEWQTYRNATESALQDFLFGASASVIQPYTFVENAGENCNNCHNELSFHGAGRRSPDTCLMCHATPGPAVHYRTLLHELHAEAFPVMPNGAAQCSKCHGPDTTVVNGPTSRNHPTAQVKPAKDWTNTCTACHSSAAAKAHVESQTGSTGVESCPTCHGEGKELPVAAQHMAQLAP